MEAVLAPVQSFFDALALFLAEHPLVGEGYTAFVRFLYPALAVLILYRRCGPF